MATPYGDRDYAVTRTFSTTGSWPDWITAIIGVWLIITPWLGTLGGGSSASWNAFICGILVLGFSLWSISMPAAFKEWINLIIGVWLIISPWVVGYVGQPNAFWNELICGILVVIFAGTQIAALRRTPTAV